MQSQATKQEKVAKNMSVYYRHLTVTFNSYVRIKQPNMPNKDKFYKVHSPEKFKLRPKDDIYLDLKFDIQTPVIKRNGITYRKNCLIISL